MTVSKTVLLQQRFSRMGSLFIEVTGNPAITTSDDFISNGMPYYGSSEVITPPVYATIPFNIGNGSPFNLSVANASIDASEFDYVYIGSPFWVKKSLAPPPVSFNATRMFMIF